jgi:hypothetical protein
MGWWSKLFGNTPDQPQGRLASAKPVSTAPITDVAPGSECRDATVYALLHAKDKNIRVNAACELGNSQDPSVVEPLVKALQDSSESVVINAASALGEIGDPSAIPALINLLEQPEIWSAPPSSLPTGYFLINALKKIQDDRSINALAAILRAPEGQWIRPEDTNFETKYKYILEVLEQMEDPRAAEAIVSMVCNSRTIQMQAAKILRGKGRGPDAERFIQLANAQTNFPALQKQFAQSRSPLEQTEALAIIANLGPEHLWPWLKPYLSGGSYCFKEIVQALVWTECVQAEEEILQAVEHDANKSIEAGIESAIVLISKNFPDCNISHTFADRMLKKVKAIREERISALGLTSKNDDELIDILRSTSDEFRVRAIGEEFNRRGGIEAMRRAHSASGGSRLLDMEWDGIGSWQG